MKHKQSTILLWQISSQSGRMICIGPAVVQLPCCVQLLGTPWTAACQVPHPSPSPRVCPSSCLLHQWCHPVIPSRDALFSFCHQSFPTSGNFPMSQLFASDDQNTGVLASTSNPSSEYSEPISLKSDWLNLLAVQATLRSLHPHHSSKATILWRFAFFTIQLSEPYVATEKTTALTIWTFVDRVMSLLFNTLSRFVIAFLPGSNHLLISWLQSPSPVILEPKKRKSVTTSTFAPLFVIK